MISSSLWSEVCGFLERLGDPPGFSKAQGLREDLSLYLELLLNKNQEVNLTAIVEIEAAVWKHFADSLALCQWEPLGAVLDWGSGGGLPGIPLALARKAVGSPSPVCFLDSVGKKIRAVEEFLPPLGLRHSHCFHQRGEVFFKDGGRGVETVVMRAVAPAPRVVPWLTPSVPRFLLFLGPAQLASWDAEERGINGRGFVFGRRVSFELPNGHGTRILLELLSSDSNGKKIYNAPRST